MPRDSRETSMFVVVLLSLAMPGVSPGQAPPVDFNRDIRPIFNRNCVACHGGVKQASGLSFIVREKLLAPARSGDIAVHPGDPEKSELIRRITSKDETERMPPSEKGPALSAQEIALLRQWIKEGAKWEEHWAYVIPKTPVIPEVADPAWARQTFDRFILSRLDREKLKPSSPADRLQWLRRVSFDLTGFPPTPAEARAFIDDTSDQAFEKVVDRLLASPGFGERWATPWLDLGRYADTNGFERDANRTVWPYRDWLIRSLNADMPYDQLLIRQIAGDLLPEATIDDRVATIFHRNTQTNAEGGTDDEEFRVAAVVDRVNTTWEAFQGVTFRCTQCHSHTYDPIDQTEFYRFLALFNTTRDWDLKTEQPLLRVPSNAEDYARAQELDGQIIKLDVAERAQIEQLEKLAIGAWRSLKPSAASSTRLTQLSIQQEGEQWDIVTGATVSHGSRFTIEVPIADETRMTALKVEALPRDLSKARLTPELGFIVSQIQVSIRRPAADGAEASLAEVQFARVLGDETDPFQEPEATLNPNAQGWGALPRIDRPRHAVFVPAEAVVAPAGATLQVVMTFNNAANDESPLVMNRVRLALSQDESWTKLNADPAFASRHDELTNLRRQRNAMPGVSVPVMKEQDAGQQRVTAMFVRGNWLDKGDVVTPGIPKLFGQLPADAPADRLALVKWMTSPQNPLTARVAVNRFWEQLFGTGIVETLEDFGSSGAAPSHPELLDYLALRFQNELKWSTKQLLRELVLSATYRQDSRVRPELLEKDKANRLLTRGPRTRLTAEMVRDQAMAASGLLSAKMYGPPVMPVQPAGIWRSVYSSARWETSRGEDAYRRAVYTFWKRTAGYPGIAMFDVPSREVCTARRVVTNTPLQALVTLNDPVYMEAASALARRVSEGEADVSKQIARAWELAAGRLPDEKDVKVLVDLYDRSLERFKADEPAAAKVGSTPQQAALSVVANAILNLDVALTK